MTPRHRERMLFATLPWVNRAQQEHDVLAQVLRDHGVEVLYLTELLQDCLEYQDARAEAVSAALANDGLGDDLRGQLRSHLENLGPESLTQVLIAGMTPQEFRIGRGVVFELLDRHDFVLDPLPNLVFTKDSSFWIGDQVAVASLVAERRREADLTKIVYRHHPRFAGAKWLYQPELEHLDGGDVLLLAPGVVAVGVGERTAPAGAERLARRLFDTSLAHTVLAVPLSQQGRSGYLDTVCAVIGHDTVVMHPAAAYSMTAHTITPQADGMRVSRPQPFLEAAAHAMGISRLRVIDTGADVVGWRDQWDEGSNVLAIGSRLAICHERSSHTNARLQEAGVQIIEVPSSELSSLRGGPRCMSCPVSRDAAVMPLDTVEAGPGDQAPPLYRENLVLTDTDRATSTLPEFAEAAASAAATVPASRREAAGGQDQGRQEELASTSLGNCALSDPSSRAPTGAECPEQQCGDDDDQADHEDRHEEVQDQGSYPEHHDHGCDQHKHTEHKYTVRGAGRVCHSQAGGRRSRSCMRLCTDLAMRVRLETAH